MTADIAEKTRGLPFSFVREMLHNYTAEWAAKGQHKGAKRSAEYFFAAVLSEKPLKAATGRIGQEPTDIRTRAGRKSLLIWWRVLTNRGKVV